MVPKTRTGYRPDIDGLRAIAVISVIAYHIGSSTFTGGFVGVDVFFVISGYLISSIILKEVRAGSFTIVKFYERRAKRILPALAGILAFCYLIGILILSPKELRDLCRNAIATILSCSNILFWWKTNYFSPSADQNPMLMTWSLGVEEQFYLFFPPLLILLAKVAPRRQFAIVASIVMSSFAASVAVMHRSQSATFFLLPTRAWELGAGVLLSMAESSDTAGDWAARRPWLANCMGALGLTMIAYPVIAYKSQTPFPGLTAIPPVVGAVLIISARLSFANRLLSIRPLVFIGLMSYSLYLWHWPLLSFARISADRPITVSMAFAIALLSTGAAYLSYRFIEIPFRKPVSGTPVLLRRYALVCLLLLAPGALIFKVQGLPSRNAAAANIDRLSDAVTNEPCIAPYGSSQIDLAAACRPDSAGPAVLLWGDSHAHAIAPAMRVAAVQSGFGFYETTKSSCPPLQSVTRNAVGHPLHANQCTAFNRNVEDLISQHPEIKTVVLAAYWSAPFRGQSDGVRYISDGEAPESVSPQRSQQNLETGLTQAMTFLKQARKNVIVVEDNPFLNFDPPRRALASIIGPRRLIASLVSPQTVSDDNDLTRDFYNHDNDPARAVIARVLSRKPDIRWLDLSSGLCNDRGCRFSDRDGLLYVDPQHLSPNGAQRALADFRFR
jgi:peptidoglycan/LPS O-acetylase OafA/YrhL